MPYVYHIKLDAQGPGPGYPKPQDHYTGPRPGTSSVHLPQERPTGASRPFSDHPSDSEGHAKGAALTGPQIASMGLPDLDANTGGGLVTHDGQVHTWTTAEHPAHVYALRHLGLQPSDVKQWLSYNRGWTDLTGSYGDDYQGIWDTMHEPGGEWHFGKTADLSPSADAQHSLAWEPGTWGKGIVFRDGSLHTWPTSAGPGMTDDDGSPYHVHYMRDNGLLDKKREQFFHIAPNGTASYSSYYDDHIKAIEPRIKREQNLSDWDFTSMKHAWNGTQRPLILQEMRTPKEQGYHYDPSDAHANVNRRPFIEWDGFVYLGQPGTHHKDIFKEQYNRTPLPKEAISNYGEVFDDGTITGPNVSDEAKQLVADHLGIEYQPQQESDGWDFTSANVNDEGLIPLHELQPGPVQHPMQWEPGKDGKGLVDPDGQVYTWHPMGGWPHHYQAMNWLRSQQAAHPGLGDYSTDDYLRSRRGWKSFFVHPNGNVQLATDNTGNSPELLDQVKDHMRALGGGDIDDDEGWRFGSQGIIDLSQHPSANLNADPAWPRTPVISTDKGLYHGPVGGYHNDLMLAVHDHEGAYPQDYAAGYFYDRHDPSAEVPAGAEGWLMGDPHHNHGSLLAQHAAQFGPANVHDTDSDSDPNLYAFGGLNLHNASALADPATELKIAAIRLRTLTDVDNLSSGRSGSLSVVAGMNCQMGDETVRVQRLEPDGRVWVQRMSGQMLKLAGHQLKTAGPWWAPDLKEDYFPYQVVHHPQYGTDVYIGGKNDSHGYLDDMGEEIDRGYFHTHPAHPDNEYMNDDIKKLVTDEWEDGRTAAWDPPVFHPSEPSLDDVKPGHRVITLNDGRWVTGPRNHQDVIKDAGLSLDQIDRMGMRSYDTNEHAHWTWLDDEGQQMRNQWAFAARSASPRLITADMVAGDEDDWVFAIGQQAQAYDEWQFGPDTETTWPDGSPRS
jgi:hypothetical protein